MSERKLADGWRKGAVVVRDVETCTETPVPVFFHEGYEEFHPRGIAPDKCFEPEPAPKTAAEQLAERGQAVVTQFNEAKHGRHLYVRVLHEPLRPDGIPDRTEARYAGQVGRLTSMRSPGDRPPYALVVFGGGSEWIWCHNLDVLSEDEVLALLNRGEMP